MEYGGNGDYYINLLETKKEVPVRLSVRFAMSGGIAPIEVKLAVANLFKVLEEAGLNKHPKEDARTKVFVAAEVPPEAFDGPSKSKTWVDDVISPAKRIQDAAELKTLRKEFSRVEADLNYCLGVFRVISDIGLSHPTMCKNAAIDILNKFRKEHEDRNT
jgi:hypothetical protein